MLRIIAGTKRGVHLKIPPLEITRPTSDRARGAIFNILEHNFLHKDGSTRLREACVLDAFAGSGALGLEALSRGAKHTFFIEPHPLARQILMKNIALLDMTKKTTVLQKAISDSWTLPTSLEQCFDLIFLDPPYGKDYASLTLLNKDFLRTLKPNALIVLETEAKTSLDILTSHYNIIDQRHYGRGKISFLINHNFLIGEIPKKDF